MRLKSLVPSLALVVLCACAGGDSDTDPGDSAGEGGSQPAGAAGATSGGSAGTTGGSGQTAAGGTAGKSGAGNAGHAGESGGAAGSSGGSAGVNAGGGLPPVGGSGPGGSAGVGGAGGVGGGQAGTSGTSGQSGSAGGSTGGAAGMSGSSGQGGAGSGGAAGTTGGKAGGAGSSGSSGMGGKAGSSGSSGASGSAGSSGAPLDCKDTGSEPNDSEVLATPACKPAPCDVTDKDTTGSVGYKGSLAAVTGVVSPDDTDFYRFHGNDGFDVIHPAIVDPAIKTSDGGLHLCMFISCDMGITQNFKCTSSGATVEKSPNGLQGCCLDGPGEVTAKYDCSGGTDDTSTIYMGISSLDDVCTPYSVDFHF